MLTHPTVDKLLQLRCAGMAKALAEQLDTPEVEALSFEERLGLLVDRELTERHSRQLTNRLRRARLKHQACIKDIDFRHRRGLDRQLVLGLADGRWVREHLNVLISGPTGIGKSWLACAFAHSACRNGHSALYVRVSRLLSELATARADGRYPRRLESLAKTEVLVMDDWGLTPFSAENRLDLLEVLEDRHGVRSTVVTSQLPVDKWHDVVGDPTLGDAILDRLVHNAYKLDLEGRLDAQTAPALDSNREPGLMTAVPRCLVTTDDRPDNPDRFRLARPGAVTPGSGGHGAAPSPMSLRPRPARPSRIRPKWNIDFGRGGTPIPGCGTSIPGRSGTPAPVRYVTV